MGRQDLQIKAQLENISAISISLTEDWYFKVSITSPI
jgi:hypothetical protein